MGDPLHASAVAVNGNAVLITGASGSGKSTLALSLIGLGAMLVADDRVYVEKQGEGLRLDAPAPISGKVEARGFGILELPASPAFARMVVDLDTIENERLPTGKTITLSGVTLPLFHKVESPAFSAMIYIYLLKEMWNE